MLSWTKFCLMSMKLDSPQQTQLLLLLERQKFWTHILKLIFAHPIPKSESEKPINIFIFFYISPSKVSRFSSPSNPSSISELFSKLYLTITSNMMWSKFTDAFDCSFFWNWIAFWSQSHDFTFDSESLFSWVAHFCFSKNRWAWSEHYPT